MYYSCLEMFRDVASIKHIPHIELVYPINVQNSMELLEDITGSGKLVHPYVVKS